MYIDEAQVHRDSKHDEFRIDQTLHSDEEPDYEHAEGDDLDLVRPCTVSLCPVLQHGYGNLVSQCNTFVSALRHWSDRYRPRVASAYARIGFRLRTVGC